MLTRISRALHVLRLATAAHCAQRRVFTSGLSPPAPPPGAMIRSGTLVLEAFQIPHVTLAEVREQLPQVTTKLIALADCDMASRSTLVHCFLLSLISSYEKELAKSKDEIVAAKDKVIAATDKFVSAKDELQGQLLASKEELVSAKDELQGQLLASKEELVSAKDELQGQLVALSTKSKEELVAASEKSKEDLVSAKDEVSAVKDKVVAAGEAAQVVQSRVYALEKQLGYALDRYLTEAGKLGRRMVAEAVRSLIDEKLV
jgi:hypothetical protein